MSAEEESSKSLEKFYRAEFHKIGGWFVYGPKCALSFKTKGEAETMAEKLNEAHFISLQKWNKLKIWLQSVSFGDGGNLPLPAEVLNKMIEFEK